MKINKLKNESGITLVELLIALALFSIITIIIISCLVMGMNSSKNVQKDVSLHDEANTVMTQLVKVIYEATSVVEENAVDEKITKIKVKNYHGKITILNLEDDQVLQKVLQKDQEPDQKFIESKGDPIHSPNIHVLSEESTFEIKDPNVVVELVFQDAETGKKLELTREISYVNVEGEEREIDEE